MTSFVSSRELEAAKQQRKRQKREMREEILREAKDKFERDRERQEFKRQTGEDKWMAPGVSERLGFTNDDGSPERKKKKRKKHRKEHKKHKKHKTAKDEKHRSGDESSSASGSESDEMWVEKSSAGENRENVTDSVTSKVRVHAEASTGQDASNPPKRDDWMTTPLAPSVLSMAILSGKRETKEEKPEDNNKQCLDKPGQHPLELNPYWKDGGKGLPTQDKTRSKRSSAKTGDGGRSWMLRAYKRAIEQGESEGRSLKEIATERWGSLEKLHSLLVTAGVDPNNPDAPPRSGKKEYLYAGRAGMERRSDEHYRRRERGNKQEGEWEGESSPRDSSYSRSSRSLERRSDEHYREREEERDRRPREGRDSRSYHSRSSSKKEGFMKPGESRNLEGGHSVATSLLTESTSQSWRKKKLAAELPDKASNVESRLMHEHSCSPEGEQDMPSPPRQDSHQSEDVPTEPITDSQLNAIGAKLMKAELIGDTDKIEMLKKQLEHLRKMKELQEQQKKISKGSEKGKTVREDKTVVLTKTDRFGRVKPLELPSKAGPSKTPTHTKKGKRNKYFDDDDQYSLKSLMEQERMTTAEETHAQIARMASKFIPASNTDESIDDALDSKSATKFDPSKEQERQKQKAIFESRKMTEVLEKCKFCFDNPNFNKHLLLAVGMNVYLTVPAHKSLTEGHCLLVPMEHATCSISIDENVWSEIRIFQTGLTHMFMEHDMDVVFMETYMSSKSMSHMFIECIPVPKEEGEVAPMYFKKAVLECDEEWAQNKKLIDTRKKGVRKSIPAGLPYFFVDFGLDGGYAHIIEDQTKFPHYFGKEVVGGLLDVEPRLWLRPPIENFEQQKQKVLRLSEWWKPYDWTQKLRD